MNYGLLWLFLLDCISDYFVFLNSNLEILFCDHIFVYSIRLYRSNMDRIMRIHAGGPHWPEQDAQIGIAWIVGAD